MKIKVFLIFLTSLLLLNCSKDDSPKLSSENKILSFKLTSSQGSTYVGKIDNSNRTVTFTTIGFETEKSLTPQIEISEKAQISPDKNIAQNFNENVTYTITAENGEKAIYKVIISNTPYSSEKKILEFKFKIDNESFVGNIDQTNLVINVVTYKDISNLSPEIVVSNNAQISPSIETKQNFSNPVEYTVTAQDGTRNTYKVIVTKPEITYTFTKVYIRAVSSGYVNNINLTESSKYKLYLENDKNSYLLDYFEVNTFPTVNGGVVSYFNFKFDEKIISASNYKLRVKTEGIIKAETNYTIDVLAENAPKITSANQTSYTNYDTLILTGTNLIPGVSIPANGSIYNLTDYYVNLNSEKTILKYYMDAYQMFPSSMGQKSPRSTRVSVYYDGRYGDSIVLDFK
ncbi:DUF5018 domain-containing protein [Flavobacterium zhairuonense]|uniref:DUF5018 domain-containing protein n=1 Tax=Flavobacterium zhairuonense TaxID=2493631 RepID=UPI00104EE51E|nr:DUF5018 domain-containing protein [Flavobacterium zhairuonense]KAF2507936.1 DUF5018 domain-containing protein [Flavobacterium zhairuonense]